MTNKGHVFTLSAGDRVWCPNEKECYKLGRIKEKSTTNDDPTQVNYTVFDPEDYRSWTAKEGEIWPANPESMDGVPDNTQLMHLHDAALLHNLRQRYFLDQIYTYTAYILIAINPYKRIGDLYNDDLIKQYSNKSIGFLPPHVYAIADRAFRSMKNTNKNQSIVVSGESGAGKTETCKFVMRYFAVVAGAGEGEVRELEQKILESNPILESFGNAKTLRNNNSSRFGKFTELHFDKNAKLCGASIVTYLLEKSRLVGQAKGERNFHIFYQLVTGASEEERKRWKLLNKPEDYNYLKSSGGAVITVEGVDDAEDFKQLKNHMAAVGLMDHDNIFSLLSGLLHLGNVSFISVPASESKSKTDDEDVTKISPSSQTSLELAAALLGVTKEKLEHALLHRTIIVGKKRGQKDEKENTYQIPLSAQEANYARDALAKYVYGVLFDWIVSKINKNIPSENSTTFIGILDISGFEIFENNSFEQFCINFANEKIQQYFNQQILKQEQEIYLLEGLKWRKVEYEDNQEVINLVEDKRTGIFALLDEECIMPKGSDKSFTSKVHTTHTSNGHLDIPKYSKNDKSQRLNKDEGYLVHHFAGSVLYNTQSFLDKNNDTLHDDLLELLRISKESFVKVLFAKEEEGTLVVGSKRFKSVSSKFNQQLVHLMEELNGTNSHFIRCIKPNELQKPGIFNPHSIMTQLRYNGMCTALRLMQSGFPTRCSFEDLYNRYSPLMPYAIAKLKPVLFCEALLVALDLHGGRDFQMGLTKVFFSSGKLQFLDDLTSTSQGTINDIAEKVRRWLARKFLRAGMFAVISLNRLGKQVESIRRLRRLRKASRIMCGIAQTWVPLLQRARQQILTSEEYKRKVAEEAARKEAQRLAELKRIEEEERQRREKKESRARAREEARRALEDQRRLEEEGRKSAEDKLNAAYQKISDLGDSLQNEQQKNRQLELQKQQLEERIKETEMEKNLEIDDKERVREELQRERERLREELQQKLLAEQNKVETLTRQKEQLTLDLENEKAKVEQLREELRLQREMTDALEREVESLTEVKEDLMASLKQEKSLVASLRTDLQNEKEAREKENLENKTTIETIQLHASMDQQTKQAIIKKLEGDNQSLSEKLAVETQTSTKKIEELTDDLHNLTEKEAIVRADYKSLKKEHKLLKEKMESMEEEREKLVQTALKAQEAERKLKQIAIRFKKPEDLAKALFGDLSFNTVMKGGATLYGALMKQGGKHVSKWQYRHVVLSENFVFYYGSPGEKEPRGLIRMDQAVCSKVDLRKLHKDNAFTIIMRDKEARAYYFAATSEKECDEWVNALVTAQSSTLFSDQ